MNTIQVFNVQNKLNGQLINEDLLTEQQVLENLINNSKMDNEDIQSALLRIKKTEETFFVELASGNTAYFSTKNVVLH